MSDFILITTRVSQILLDFCLLKAFCTRSLNMSAGAYKSHINGFNIIHQSQRGFLIHLLIARYMGLCNCKHHLKGYVLFRHFNPFLSYLQRIV